MLSYLLSTNGYWKFTGRKETSASTVPFIDTLPLPEWAIVQKWVPYSQRYLFNAIPDTNHNNANPTNPNRYSKGNPNPTNPTNPNTRYRCELGNHFCRIA